MYRCPSCYRVTKEIGNGVCSECLAKKFGKDKTINFGYFKTCKPTKKEKEDRQ